MLTLQPLSGLDAMALHRATQNPEFISGLKYKKPLTIAESKEDIEKKITLCNEKKAEIYSAQISYHVIGQIGAKEQENHYQLWYWIIPEFQGKGYGKQMLAQFLQICRLRPLHATIKDWNVRSKSIALSAGFKERNDVFVLQ